MDEYPQVPAYIAERYKVGRTIGDGNFAVVRECVERSTGREYALKIINKGKCRGKVGGPSPWLCEVVDFYPFANSTESWIKGQLRNPWIS